MKQKNLIFLPSEDKQLINLINRIELKEKSILVIGANSEEIATVLKQHYDSEIIVIVDDNDSLIKSRFILSDDKKISVRLMDYANTDFKDDKFDLIFAQASITNPQRNKIVKEIKRILKPGGIFCIGEIVKLSKDPPQFVKDIWESSALSPFHLDEIENYYSSRGFELIFKEDLSYTLKNFYINAGNLLKEKKDLLSEAEKTYHKKLLKKINHESNVYLKLGGNEHIGFAMLILKKKEIE